LSITVYKVKRFRPFPEVWFEMLVSDEDLNSFHGSVDDKAETCNSIGTVAK